MEQAYRVLLSKGTTLNSTFERTPWMSQEEVVAASATLTEQRVSNNSVEVKPSWIDLE